MSVAIGVSTVFLSCHANVMSLEMISATEEGKNFGYCLTFLQFVAVSLLSLPQIIFVCRRPTGKKIRRRNDNNNITSCKSPHYAPPLVSFPLVGNWAIGIRPIFTSIRMLALMSFIFWFTSLLNNLALGFSISVPLHAVFRSSSLLFNMLLGVTFVNKRFSLQQVMCVIMLTGGLILLTYLQTLKSDKSEQRLLSAEYSDERENTTARQYMGLLMLIVTSMTAPVLAMVQEATMKGGVTSGNDVQKMSNDEEELLVSYAPRWVEAMSWSHIFAIPLFFLSSYSSFTHDNFFSLPSSQYRQLLVNIISQYFCVSGVFSIAVYASAFVLTLTLTLRKAFSIVFSLMYFGHFFVLSPIEYVCILVVCAAGSIYPFLKKAPEHKKSCANQSSGYTIGSKAMVKENNKNL